MKALPIEVTLNTIGKDKLEKPLTGTIKVPVPDNMLEVPVDADWMAHFRANWPAGDSYFEKPSINDVIIEGLKTLARREKVSEMIAEYRKTHGGNGKRGRGTPMTLEDVKRK